MVNSGSMIYLIDVTGKSYDTPVKCFRFFHVRKLPAICIVSRDPLLVVGDDPALLSWNHLVHVLPNFTPQDVWWVYRWIYFYLFRF